MSTPENRRSLRLNHDSILEIYDAEGHFITGVGRLVNYSDVGVCFSSAKVLTKGEKLYTRLRLRKEAAMDFPARVVWVKKNPSQTLYGVAFDSIQKLTPQK